MPFPAIKVRTQTTLGFLGVVFLCAKTMKEGAAHVFEKSEERRSCAMRTRYHRNTEDR